jgi:hypothetical protein
MATGLKALAHPISDKQRFSHVQSSSPKKIARPVNGVNVAYSQNHQTNGKNIVTPVALNYLLLR